MVLSNEYVVYEVKYFFCKYFYMQLEIEIYYGIDMLLATHAASVASNCKKCLSKFTNRWCNLDENGHKLSLDHRRQHVQRPAS